MNRLFMTYREVATALMSVGMRDIETRRALRCGQEAIPPHPHGMHSQRRWLRGAVESYCETLKMGAAR